MPPCVLEPMWGPLLKIRGLRKLAQRVGEKPGVISQLHTRSVAFCLPTLVKLAWTPVGSGYWKRLVPAFPGKLGGTHMGVRLGSLWHTA